MFWVYILQNKRHRLYIGQTNNLHDRIRRHNSGRVQYSRLRGPWRLIYKKVFATRSEAMRYERYLKSLKNPNFLHLKIIGE